MYKRQPVFYIIGGITALAVVLAILSFSVFHITALGVLFSVVTAALAAPVSYTHLDVYKRQPYSLGFMSSFRAKTPPFFSTRRLSSNSLRISAPMTLW